MDYPLIVNLEASPDAVASMIAADQLRELCQVRLTRWMTWRMVEPTHFIGKIPYLRSKNLSGFRFHVNLEAAETGSYAAVTVEPAAFFLKHRWIVYVLGLLMFCIGVLFPIVGFSLLDKRVAEIQADIGNTLSHWKESSA